MSLLIYLFKTILISGLLFGYYQFLLRDRPFNRFNRYFLLGTAILGLLLPLLRLHLPAFWTPHSSGKPIRLLGVGPGSLEEVVTVYGHRGFWGRLPWEFIALMAGLCISLFLLIRFCLTLRYLHLLRRNNPRRPLPEASLYLVSAKGTPFSFFRNIFWNPETDLESPEGRQMLQHELYHVKHLHSLDLLMLEITCILCWFNPFIYYIRREIQVVHEFLADHHVAADTNRLEYAGLLLTESSGGSLPMTHPFFHNQIKRRIDMITQNKKTKRRLLNRILILPVLLMLFGLFAFRFENRRGLSSAAPKTIRVVVDAGHGGMDPGAIVFGIPEKEIALRIARKIQELSAPYAIEVIMTRNEDILPGHARNIRDGLIYRAALPSKTGADLFVSIHIGADHSLPSGFDFYIPAGKNPVYSGSVKLGSGISESIQKDFAVAPMLKQRTSPDILILSRATVPALLIECGNLDKKSDFDFMMDEKNQDKIARDILEGIRKFALNSVAESDPAVLQENAGSFRKHQPDTAQPRKKVEFEAEFPGGQQGWRQYLIRNLKYPAEAAGKKIQGNVPVEFIVEADGQITHIHPISGPIPLREEAARVIRESGKWKPAKDQGEIVRSYHIQPIVFRLND